MITIIICITQPEGEERKERKTESSHATCQTFATRVNKRRKKKYCTCSPQGFHFDYTTEAQLMIIIIQRPFYSDCIPIPWSIIQIGTLLTLADLWVWKVKPSLTSINVVVSHWQFIAMSPIRIFRFIKILSRGKFAVVVVVVECSGAQVNWEL